jgi:ATP-dependent RNA helicase DeaD
MEQFHEGHINILVATDLLLEELTLRKFHVVTTYLMLTNLMCTVQVITSGKGKGLSLTVLQPEEEKEIADFEKS